MNELNLLLDDNLPGWKTAVSSHLEIKHSAFRWLFAQEGFTNLEIASAIRTMIACRREAFAMIESALDSAERPANAKHPRRHAIKKADFDVLSMRFRPDWGPFNIRKFGYPSGLNEYLTGKGFIYEDGKWYAPDQPVSWGNKMD